MERKIYTVQEANRLLPVVRGVVATIQDRMSWLAANRPRIHFLVKEFKIPMDSPVPGEYFSGLLTLRKALGELEALGCQLKDVQKGLIDFPARLSGKDVLLCWRMDEESVGFYHDLESGYAGRRPIPEPDTDSDLVPKDDPSGDAH
jgi:hypothetical protein